MTISLSQRVQRVKPSPTLSLNARVTQLKAEGQDIINLTVGEPDFDTPAHIKEGGIKAILDGYTKYTAVDGLPLLKQAILKKFQRENSLQYEPKQILVSSGCKQAIYNLLQTLINDGDEVIIPSPYWVSYPDMVYLAGGVPVFVSTTIDQQFKMTPAQLEKAITLNTKLLILNSPSNPSGMVYSKAELAALGEVLLRHPNIVIASDDIYEHLQWTGNPFSNIINACPALYGRTVILNGVSKTYAMTGWRIGYCAGPIELITAMGTIQSQSTSNANAMAQIASEVALNGPQEFIAEMKRTYHERANFIAAQFKDIPGAKCILPQGTFYVFPDLSAFLNKIPHITDDIQLAEYLLVQAKVAVVPGSPFGNPGCIRLSTTLNLNLLGEAMSRIKKLLEPV